MDSSLLQITRENVLDMMQSLTNGEIAFRVFFDRASDGDARFIPVVQWACDHVVHHINFHKLACHAWDKVAMHQVISVSMETPLTIALPSYEEEPLLPEIDLSPLGERFTIKPAYGGGGVGVINEATTLSQVLAARQEFPTRDTCCRPISFRSALVPERPGFESSIVQERSIHVGGTIRRIFIPMLLLVMRRATTLVRYAASRPPLPTSVALHCFLLKLLFLLMAVLSS